MELSEGIPHGLRECHLRAVARIAELEDLYAGDFPVANKFISHLFADMLAMSNRKLPLDTDGERKRTGTLYIGSFDREAILEAMARLHCRGVEFGSYACTGAIKGSDITVDYCLVPEINRLNNAGIKTIGCCCGHGRRVGYIQVDPLCLESMREHGYVELPIDENGNGHWCFKPKTSVPESPNHTQTDTVVYGKESEE
jgi:hypothetical protein